MAMRECKYGHVHVPEPLGGGTYSDKVRWLRVRDGIGDIIAYLPTTERVLATRLGDLWIEAHERMCKVMADRGSGWNLLS
jgi:hypothetical protein